MASRDKHDRMANAIRFLSMDAVEKANSGHPGLPMGCADIATVLFTRYLKYDPKNPKWPDRDRFVLSAGHGSMLLYSCLYLTGYEDMTIDQIERFRQLGSKTAGHPEYGFASGYRDHHRPARPGCRQLGRNGARRARHERAVRRRPRRPLHLCDLRRRLPDGRHQPGSHRAGRPPQAQQADRLLGQQLDLDRRSGLPVELDRPGRSRQGVRLERLPHRRPRSGSHRRGNRDRAEVRPPDADRRQDHHRLRRADQGRHQGRAWLAARQGRDRWRAQGAELGFAALRHPGRHIVGLARGRFARRALPAPIGKSASPHRATAAPNSSAASPASCPRISTTPSPPTSRSWRPTSRRSRPASRPRWRWR